MKEDLALHVLSNIMDWDDDRAMNEFRWLRLMSRFKYDGYQDFLAGVRFIESLVTWLQQFEHAEEREKAYGFVRHALVYIGPAEMQRLVELFYPSEVERRLVRSVAESRSVPPYRIWANSAAAKAYDKLLRQTLFIGLSEGARLDHFRRANAMISNEHVLLATYADREKWDKLLEDLQDDLEDPKSTFRFVYLIDDFTASGTSFIRKKDGKWKGKLARFRSTIEEVLGTHFDSGLTICVHHYMATGNAVDVLKSRHMEALNERGRSKWFPNVEFTFGTVLPETLPIDRSPCPEAQEFISLAKRYCDRKDPLLNNKHFKEGNTKDPALGFADCALPIVLEHNTPNNSVALLWAETPSSGSAVVPERHAMRPLFRRRQRHA